MEQLKKFIDDKLSADLSRVSRDFSRENLATKKEFNEDLCDLRAGVKKM